MSFFCQQVQLAALELVAKANGMAIVYNRIDVRSCHGGSGGV